MRASLGVGRLITRIRYQYIAALISTYLPEDQEEGQGLVEYALIIALIAVALVAGIGVLGTDIGEVFTRIGTELDGA